MVTITDPGIVSTMNANPESIGPPGQMVDDGSDYIHSGFAKYIMQLARGNQALVGFDITMSDGGTYTRITMADGEILRENQHVSISPGTKYVDLKSSTAPATEANKDYYGWIVVDSSGAYQFRGDEFTLSSTTQPNVAELYDYDAATYTLDDTIIALVKIAGGSANNDTTRPIQYFTNSRSASPYTIGYNSGGYTAAGTFTGSATGVALDNVLTSTRLITSTSGDTSDLAVQLPNSAGGNNGWYLDPDVNNGVKLRVDGTADYNFGKTTLSTSNLLRVGAGTEGGPSLSFAADPNSGLYNIGANNVGMAVGGNLVCNWTTAATNINPDGDDVDTIIEGTSDANLVYVNAGTNMVGVGIAAPTNKLHVYDSTNEVVAKFESGDAHAGIAVDAPSGYAVTFYSIAGVNQWSTGRNGSGFFNIYDEVGGASRLTISDTSGYVGINTNSPLAPLHLISSGTNDVVLIESTDSGASAAPDLSLYRNSASPAAGDILSHLRWFGQDTVGKQEYASIYVTILNENDGAEAAQMDIMGMVGGSSRKFLSLSDSESVFNEEAEDIDHRVEGKTDANLLFVDAGNDKVGIGVNPPTEKLEVNGNIKGDDIIANTYNGEFPHQLGKIHLTEQFTAPAMFGTIGAIVAPTAGGPAWPAGPYVPGSHVITLAQLLAALGWTGSNLQGPVAYINDAGTDINGTTPPFGYRIGDGAFIVFAHYSLHMQYAGGSTNYLNDWLADPAPGGGPTLTAGVGLTNWRANDGVGAINTEGVPTEGPMIEGEHYIMDYANNQIDYTPLLVQLDAAGAGTNTAWLSMEFALVRGIAP